MEQEKVYAIGDNKCLIETMTKEQIDTAISESGGEYTLPVATAETLGGIKVGRGINTATDGKASVNFVSLGIEKNNSIGVGTYSLYYNTAAGNVAIGYQASQNNTTGYGNIAIGNTALITNTTGYQNVAIGRNTLRKNIIGGNNVAIGDDALSVNTTDSNIAIGSFTLSGNTTGYSNIAIGPSALRGNIAGANNTAIGQFALYQNTTGSSNVAIGQAALNSTNFDNCVGLGNGATVTGESQIQLGISGQTVYTFGAIQNRSDKRDKTDIRDTDLGLEFIKKLHPVKFRWDYRESYVDNEIDENGEPVRIEHEKDGSRAGKRFHEGLIAQEVKKVMDEMGVEFAGYQDHSVNGGKDVLSIGYTELIGPLIKAVQELSNEVTELKQQLSKVNNG